MYVVPLTGESYKGEACWSVCEVGPVAYVKCDLIGTRPTGECDPVDPSVCYALVCFGDTAIFDGCTAGCYCGTVPYISG